VSVTKVRRYSVKAGMQTVTPAQTSTAEKGKEN